MPAFQDRSFFRCSIFLHFECIRIFLSIKIASLQLHLQVHPQVTDNTEPCDSDLAMIITMSYHKYNKTIKNFSYLLDECWECKLPEFWDITWLRMLPELHTVPPKFLGLLAVSNEAWKTPPVHESKQNLSWKVMIVLKNYCKL